MKNKKAISFFSNAGIGDIGIEQAGIDVIYANELLKDRANIYKHNHPNTHVHAGDITQLTSDDIQTIHNLLDGEECFLLLATPPCQGFSTAGKRDDFDIRNQLLKPVMKLIKEFNPQFVLMENVMKFQTGLIPDTDNIVSNHQDYSITTIDKFMEKRASDMGYHLYMKVINMQDYGVPQSRKRVFTIFSKEELNEPFPKETNKNNPVTLRAAIGHLKPLKAGEKDDKDIYHFTKDISDTYKYWLEVTPEGKSAFENKDFDRQPTTIDKVTGERRLISCFGNAYKRMYWDKPAPTITMNSGTISSQTNVHPRDTRVLSIREIMILQTIPNTYTFPENTSEKKMRDVIGEAVPPLMFKILGEHLINQYNLMNSKEEIQLEQYMSSTKVNVIEKINDISFENHRINVIVFIENLIGYHLFEDEKEIISNILKSNKNIKSFNFSQLINELEKYKNNKNIVDLIEHLKVFYK